MVGHAVQGHVAIGIVCQHRGGKVLFRRARIFTYTARIVGTYGSYSDKQQ